jgi:prohibitin 2
VESKQVAQQEAERAKWIVEKANEEKKSIIIQAQGEAEAAKLISAAIQNNPGENVEELVDPSRPTLRQPVLMLQPRDVMLADCLLEAFVVCFPPCLHIAPVVHTRV